ncbi:MAG: putative signal transduction histidine kinase [Frankiales bacterium]|nr:putative signal transduction histidine kinase [Frankiales bacterium]
MDATMPAMPSVPPTPSTAAGPDLAAVPPRLYRVAEGRRVAGVAAGLADHLGLSRRWIRLAFIALSLGTGMGIVLYGAFWIVLPAPAHEPPRSKRSAFVFVVAIIAALAVLAFNIRTLPLGWWFVPSLLACFGGALLWRQASETERERWRRLSRGSLGANTFDRAGILRIVAGITLVLAGGVFILARAGFAAVGIGLVAMLVTGAGLALITGPWWLRLVRELTEERRERIRVEERAELAAHLHDSVLQTLALIQRSAGSPREVSRLARSQERELRSRLYGTGIPNGLFAAALHAAAAEVEDSYAITIDVVVVGDRSLDVRLDAVVAAAREAMVNAAKHAKVQTVSLYAEVSDTEVTVFVRDRGVGFDPESIDEDRQGVRGSIIGRLARQRGTAAIKSAPDEGTEITLRMELP